MKKSKSSEDDSPVVVPAIPPSDVLALREAELRMHPQYYDDVTVQWLYRPHNITWIVLFACGALYLAFFRVDTTFEQNLKAGLLACLAILIPLSIVAFPNGPFCRPHPAFWRAVSGCQAAYFFVLIVFLFQNVDGARELCKFADPKLGVPLEPKAYGSPELCVLSKKNIMAVVNDVFFYAHLVGWIVKALLLRSRAFCWTLSILWELVEVSFIPWLPNFSECWWDSWVIDVLLCNGIGIEIGLLISRYLEYKTYSWKGFTRIPTTSGKVKRAVMQLTPFSWTRVRWEVSSSVKSFLAMFLLGCFMVCAELWGFFLKDLLWVPADHWLNLGRMALWVFYGAPSLREYYLYTTDKKCKRLGINCFLAGLTLIVEGAMVFKFGKGRFNERISPLVPLVWIVAATLFVSGMIEYIVYKNWRQGKPSTKSSSTVAVEEKLIAPPQPQPKAQPKAQSQPPPPTRPKRAPPTPIRRTRGGAGTPANATTVGGRTPPTTRGRGKSGTTPIKR